MSSLHIVGFGPRPELKIESQILWIPSFPNSPYEIGPDDVIVLNLNEIHDIRHIKVMLDLVNFIRHHGGVLVGISGPNNYITKEVRRHDFLPFSNYILDSIHTYDSTSFRADSSAPRWVEFFLNCMGRDLFSSVYFTRLPRGAHSLIEFGSASVGFSYKHENGRILILPSIKSIIHGETTSSAKRSLTNFMNCLYSNVLLQYMDQSKPPPEWFDSFEVQNEEELKAQHDALGKEIQRIREEKKILIDDGTTLTRKIASHLEWLSFQTAEKEIEGKQDIEISDDKFKGIVECSGTMKHIKIRKLRQLMHCVLTSEAKGIFIGNPWKDKHPKVRKTSEAFTRDVIEGAEKLDICLATVPRFYRVCLDTQTDAEKRKVRDSLKECKGLWKYPIKNW